MISVPTGNVAADDQADLDLVVQEPHVSGPDDVVERAADRAGVLRKNVSGIDVGSMPASLTCEAKLVIWATTRHGAVTGETSARLSTGTVSVLCAAASIGRAVGEQLAGGGRASVAILAAPVGVWTHQASAVRRTVMLMRWPLSAGRAGG